MIVDHVRVSSRNFFLGGKLGLPATARGKVWEGDVPPPVEREAKNTSNFKNFYNTIRACQLMCPCLTSCGHQATSCEDSWRMKGHYALCAVCTK